MKGEHTREKGQNLKTRRTNPISRVALAIALFAGTSGIGLAGGPLASQGLVPKVIDLHAPNNATVSVTIWVPRNGIPRNGPAMERRTSTKVVDLHAPNNATPSATVWVNK